MNSNILFLLRNKQSRLFLNKESALKPDSERAIFLFRVSGIPFLVSEKGDIIFARPYGGIQGVRGFLWCVGTGLCPSRGRPQGSPLRKRYKRCGEESPSHGFAVPTPFRQGGPGDGGTDCHSQCAHWLRNDREFYMGCGGCPGGRTGASAPTEMPEHLRRAACPHAAVMVRWLTGGGLRAARPTEAYFAVRRGGALPLPRAG